jgi:hypothetical protein
MTRFSEADSNRPKEARCNQVETIIASILLKRGTDGLSFAKTQFICVFNNFACLSPNKNFLDQNLILA